MHDLNIAIVQCDLHWEDVNANLSAFDARLEKIEEGTDLIILPEMFSTGFSMNCELVAEPPSGPAFRWMQKTAAAKSAYIAGSVSLAENGNFYNRLYLVSPQGDFEYYDKRHLFRMGGENLSFTAGNRRVVAEINGWKVLLLVCYDLRFPVWSRNKYSQGSYDYDLILLVANWPTPRAEVWKTLLKARALENQCYVAGVNRSGTDGRNTPHQGDSVIISPKGEIMADCGIKDECIATAKLQKDALDNFREAFKVADDWDSFDICI